ncbi:MAG: hypothetical protein KDE63_12005, partial [Novosphingobium sp.]|nr:hypothetical protein [Novosphingobium sp.]
MSFADVCVEPELNIAGKIGLWPNSPLLERETDQESGRTYPLFPSARQALTRSLAIKGLGRSCRVGVPEWSSHCVLSAVARVATPISITDAIAGNIPLDCIVAYDQWGWRMPDSEIGNLSDLPGTPAIILDKVDSPGPQDDERARTGSCEIWSFSKVLGFGGGGLLRVNGEFAEPELTVGEFDQTLSNIGDADEWADIRKTYGKSIPKGLETINNAGGLDALIARQNSLRRANLSVLVD